MSNDMSSLTGGRPEQENAIRENIMQSQLRQDALRRGAIKESDLHEAVSQDDPQLQQQRENTAARKDERAAHSGVTGTNFLLSAVEELQEVVERLAQQTNDAFKAAKADHDALANRIVNLEAIAAPLVLKLTNGADQKDLINAPGSVMPLSDQSFSFESPLRQRIEALEQLLDHVGIRRLPEPELEPDQEQVTPATDETGIKEHGD